MSPAKRPKPVRKPRTPTAVKGATVDVDQWWTDDKKREEQTQLLSHHGDATLANQYAAYAREQMRVEIEQCVRLYDATRSFNARRSDANILRSPLCDASRKHYQDMLLATYKEIKVALTHVTQEISAEGLD